jgi:hypothetical protein
MEKMVKATAPHKKKEEQRKTKNHNTQKPKK